VSGEEGDPFSARGGFSRVRFLVREGVMWLVWLVGNTRLAGSVAFQFLQFPVIKPAVFRATRVRLEENETKKVDE